MKIEIKKLRKKILWTLLHNFSSKDAKIIADYLLWAEMSGIKTQWILKLTWSEPLQHIQPIWPIIIERETKLSQLINANKHPAPLVSQIATTSVIKKAKKHWFSIVWINNTFSSNWAQAFYAARIAKEDLIWIVCSRSPAATTGFWSIDPLFWTNPIGFSFPTENVPLVFDMATSAITRYWLILAKARWESIPDDVALDSLGNPTTNAEHAMEWALLSFDKSYKWSSLSMIIEILAWPLVWSSWIDNKTFAEQWWSLFIAINPNLLIDTNTFKTNCSDLITKVKSSRTWKEVEKIRLPWERAQESYQEALASWLVDVDEVTLQLLWY